MEQILSCNGHRVQPLGICNPKSCRTRQSHRRNRTSRIRSLELRQECEFEATHICQSVKSPLTNLDPMMRDVFGNPDALHMIWKSVKTKFDTDHGLLGSREPPINVLDYDGEPSQIATSIPHAKGYIAFSCGGFSCTEEVDFDPRTLQCYTIDFRNAELKSHIGIVLFRSIDANNLSACREVSKAASKDHEWKQIGISTRYIKKSLVIMSHVMAMFKVHTGSRNISDIHSPVPSMT